MIATANSGIIEAIEIMKRMSLIGILKEEHEMRVKARRDREAEDEYVMDQGIQIGRAEGETRKLVTMIVNQIRKNIGKEEVIHKFFELGEDLELVESIYNTAYQYAPGFDMEKILSELNSEKNNKLLN